jgi:hypothetical protein
MEPADTIEPPDALTPKYFGLESRPLRPAPPAFLVAIFLPPFRTHAYVANIRIIPRDGPQPFQKKGRSSDRSGAVGRHRIYDEPERTPLRRLGAHPDAIHGRQGPKGRSRKHGNSGANYIAADRPRSGVSIDRTGKNYSCFVDRHVSDDHRAYAPTIS